jgi:hypothetical protein
MKVNIQVEIEAPIEFQNVSEKYDEAVAEFVDRIGKLLLSEKPINGNYSALSRSESEMRTLEIYRSDYFDWGKSRVCQKK